MENQSNNIENDQQFKNEIPTNGNLGDNLKNSIIVKGLIIILIIILLLIPTGSIKRLIYERESRQNEATSEVVNKWASAQQITGPIISVPAKRVLIDQYGNETVQIRYLHILPEDLKINNTVNVTKLKRGLFNISVYENQCLLTGEFKLPNFKNLLAPNEKIEPNEAILNIGISDMRGIKNKMEIELNNDKFNLKPGPFCNDVISTGLHYPFTLDSIETFSFNLPITLKGSSNLSFVPLGRSTEVTMQSEWQDPSFYGSFLPDSREISANGFTASWKIIDLNRNFGQYWFGAKNLSSAKFGVEFIQPVDHYSKSLRSVKYAVLIICLTFIAFFFIELLQKIKIHPIQYVLVGFALVIFFLLLISISEHLTFNLAYLISSLSVTALIAAYLKPVLKSLKSVLLSSGLVAAGYGFIFITLQDQDYALLIGSIGLFVTLSAIMLLSRKINFYQH
ncbi:MAG: cell envelope integrity protein CreD [Bacteroidia bacterium]